MSVELVNDHVLLPDTADWSTPPKWSRRWHNEIADGVTGAEARAALRAQPRISLSYQLTPASVAAAQMLDDRLRAALKSGLACCPFFGRGGEITSNAGIGDEVVSVQDAFTWAAGDYFFVGDEINGEAIMVTAAVLTDGVWELTLDAAFTSAHLAGALGWPLLFGQPVVSELQALTTRLATVPITLTELVSARSAQLGTVTAPGGAGIGVMAIGSTFIIG